MFRKCLATLQQTARGFNRTKKTEAMTWQGEHCVQQHVATSGGQRSIYMLISIFSGIFGV
jgi:hypothetical protein